MVSVASLSSLSCSINLCIKSSSIYDDGINESTDCLTTMSFVMVLSLLVTLYFVTLLYDPRSEEDVSSVYVELKNVSLNISSIDSLMDS